MAKRKKKRRCRKRKPYTGKNRHHLLFQARYWNHAEAKILHDAFVYMIDIKVHDELHNAILNNIPKPSYEGILSIFKAYQAEKEEIMSFDVIQASEWLMLACDEEPYHTAMALQTLFLQERLKN